MKHASILFLVFALGFAGCASGPTSASMRIQETDETQMEIKNCQSLGSVEGSSSLTGFPFLSVGKDNARAEALERASDRGASHIVWKDLDLGMFGIVAKAKCYRCPG